MTRLSIPEIVVLEDALRDSLKAHRKAAKLRSESRQYWLEGALEVRAVLKKIRGSRVVTCERINSQWKEAA